jgi:hypothetical protein
MVKIHILERSDRAKALETLTLRGRLICLPNNVFIVPEPVAFQELERGGFDYAEKALRDSLAIRLNKAPTAQRGAIDGNPFIAPRWGLTAGHTA